MRTLLRASKTSNLDELKAEALANHPEVLAFQQNKIQAQQYLQYQKKLAIPDINLFAAYDQRGGAFLNQVNAGISIPLHSLEPKPGQYQIITVPCEGNGVQSSGDSAGKNLAICKTIMRCTRKPFLNTTKRRGSTMPTSR